MRKVCGGIMSVFNEVSVVSNYATNALKETLERYGELGFKLVNVVMAKNQYDVDTMYLFFIKTKEN